MKADRRPLQFNVWMTICALPALTLLLGLGVWQLNRLEWKEALIAERTAGLATEPVALETVLRADWQDLEFRRVVLQGKFLPDNFKLNTPVKVHNKPGYKLIAPFETSTGQTVIVDRGWMPIDLKKPELYQPTGKLSLIGILRSVGRPSPWTPNNVPEKSEWYFVDPGALATLNGYNNTMPFFVQVVPKPIPKTGLASPGTKERIVWPMPLEFDSQQPNRHLEYAVTWFGLAATLVIIYIAFHWRRRTGD